MIEDRDIALNVMAAKVRNAAENYQKLLVCEEHPLYKAEQYPDHGCETCLELFAYRLVKMEPKMTARLP